MDIKKGRFPANLLVSDDVLNDGKQYNTHSSGRGGIYKGSEMFGGGNVNRYGNDFGSFSRYFDLDAWWEEKQKENE